MLLLTGREVGRGEVGGGDVDGGEVGGGSGVADGTPGGKGVAEGIVVAVGTGMATVDKGVAVNAEAVGEATGAPGGGVSPAEAPAVGATETVEPSPAGTLCSNPDASACTVGVRVGVKVGVGVK